MNFTAINESISMSIFSSKIGVRETYISITPPKSRALFTDTLCEISAHVDTVLGLDEISMRDLVFSRLYLSDIENQKDIVRESRLYKQLSRGVLSMVGQPPLSGGSVSVLLYFVEGCSDLSSEEDTPTNVDDPWYGRRLFTGRHYSMFWAVNYTGEGTFDSAKQTRKLFTRLDKELTSNTLSMKKDLLRTWIYVRDVDNWYQGMVDARREFFERNGLNTDSRYPASTGIEGKAHTTSCLVGMDALAFGGLEDEQIIKMEALDYLSATIRYGVTFERGIRVRFGDRSHLFISGTASIDKYGEIVYPGDPLKQAERTVANMNALLEAQGASIRHMAYIILYLRDPSVFEVVRKHIATLIPHEIPLIPVTAAVCRPGWLIEMEGMAIVADDAPFPAFL